MSKWDVVLVTYPFTDLQGAKVRPAVVISPNAFNSSQDGVFVLITSNTTRQSQYEVMVGLTHPEFPNTGLSKESVIRVSKFVTLHKSMVRATIGVLGPKLASEVESQLRAFLELPPFQPQLPETPAAKK